MKFFTKYNYKDNVVSNSGSGKFLVFTKILDKNGKLKVVPKKLKNKEGKLENVYDDVYSKIQAAAESTNLKTILKKFTATGDESILMKNPGVFMDTTIYPESLIEAQNTINAQKDLFNKLPADVKKEFNNDYNQFIAAMYQPDFFKRVGYKDLNNDGVVTKSEVAKQTGVTETKGDITNE